ncbi:hypothetical protein MMC26_003919 [Xylographa opegraphella]|nr:hypothetical protein [Xylographa opegraphella]
MTALAIIQPVSTSDTNLVHHHHSSHPPAHLTLHGVASHASLLSNSSVADHLPVTPFPSPTVSHFRNTTNRGGEQVVKQNRLSIATIAREKTSKTLSNLAVRTRTSSGSLRSRSPVRHTKHYSTVSARGTAQHRSRTDPSHSSQTSRDIHSSSSSSSPDEPNFIRSTSTAPQITLDHLSDDRGPIDQRRLLARTPSPSRSIAERYIPSGHNTMHQTSSRLLRMTDEERPFTRDFKDLFATLIVSLPLGPHRVRFQRVDHTFTSEEAINNLGSLKFSQSNRMPDPKDPSRIVTTTTTTTFSMAKEMARSVCQRFMDARFIEPADGKPTSAFVLKGAVWQMTPKGLHVLTRFCQRNGINQRHVVEVMESPRNSMQLVILERDVASDKLSHDRATVEVIFRRFLGQDGPNVKPSTTSSDSDSLTDYFNGLVGVKMAAERKILDRTVPNTFTGKAAVDWLMDCCTTVDRRETYEIAELFVVNGLIWPAQEDKIFVHQNPAASRFQPTKNAVYGVTERGQILAGWIPEPSPPLERGENVAKLNTGRVDGRNGPRDSNHNRLIVIVNDPALRLLFREFLRDTHCEENLAFFIEVREFTKSYDLLDKQKAFTKLDTVRESLAAAYGLYNAFLAPGSPWELNIDHNLRNSLAARMTRAVGDDDSMLTSLQEVVHLFKEAQQSVFKLMSSDSVPKFLKEPKYAHVLRDHNFDHTSPVSNHTPSSSILPERTLSRVARDPRGP